MSDPRINTLRWDAKQYNDRIIETSEQLKNAVTEIEENIDDRSEKHKAYSKIFETMYHDTENKVLKPDTMARVINDIYQEALKGSDYSINSVFYSNCVVMRLVYNRGDPGFTLDKDSGNITSRDTGYDEIACLKINRNGKMEIEKTTKE